MDAPLTPITGERFAQLAERSFRQENNLVMSAVFINKKARLAGNRAKSWEERYNRTLQPLSRNKPSSIFHSQCPLLAQSRHELLHCTFPLPTQSGHLLERPNCQFRT